MKNGKKKKKKRMQTLKWATAHLSIRPARGAGALGERGGALGVQAGALGAGECDTARTHRRVCDAPKPGGPLTTRQPAEYKWRLGYPTPL